MDVMGQRLYEVSVSWPGRSGPGAGWNARIESMIVAASTPRHAAEIVAKQYENILERDRRPSCYGHALNVCQPSEWLDGEPEISPSACKHHRLDLISSSRGACEGNNWDAAAYICLDCGELQVSARRNGQFSRINFGLNCDWHLVAAARYMRSANERTQALARCGAGDSKKAVVETLMVGFEDGAQLTREQLQTMLNTAFGAGLIAGRNSMREENKQ